MAMKPLTILRSLLALGLACAVLSPAYAAQAQEVGGDLAARLTPAQQQAYLAYRLARSKFEREHRTYWNRVEAKRDARRARRMLGQAYTADDYVAAHPPKYQGPELPSEIARIVAEVKPPSPERLLPTVADFLTHAKTQYGFVPKRATEQDFKRKYAAEALRLGLSKDQVVRIYALETGGQGTYDMQSGINPITKQGKAISSALGYAQLLHANSTSELVRLGDTFIKRLNDMAAVPGHAGDARRRAQGQGRGPAQDAARGALDPQRVERPPALRHDAARPRHPCPQPRFRHRSLAAGATRSSRSRTPPSPLAVPTCRAPRSSS